MVTENRRGTGAALVFFFLAAAAGAGGACTGGVESSPGSGGSGASTSTSASTTSVTTTGTSAGTTSSTSSGAGAGCACPTEVPDESSPCAPCMGEMCPYTFDGCGPSAFCSATGVWQVVISTCPPAALCSLSTTPSACASSSACRWLVPGCGSAGFTAGCFDATDCVPGTGCASGQSCAAVDTDPCWDSNCTECSGGQADICTGPG
jgi:hypothetical protein